MQQLTKNGFVQSVKGPYGGFFIDTNSIKTTKLSAIVELFDGKQAYMGCVLGLRTCSDSQPCPLHKEALPILHKLKNLLSTKTLFDILYTEDSMNIFWLKTE